MFVVAADGLKGQLSLCRRAGSPPAVKQGPFVLCTGRDIRIGLSSYKYHSKSLLIA